MGSPEQLEGSARPITQGQREYERIPLLWLTTVPLRRLRVVVGTPLVACLLMLAYVSMRGERYEATASFLPQSPDTEVSRLAGWAAQFGLSAPSQAAGESVEFYTRLLQSTRLLIGVAHAEFTVPVNGGLDTLRGNLIELYEVEEETPAETTVAILDRLGDDVSANADLEAGLVRVTVVAPWPSLAVDLADHLVAAVSDFNLTQRRTRASAEKEFVEERLADAWNQLEASERELQSFLERNRTYQSSPQLTFEASRLQRQVDLRQQLYTALAQTYEQARIEQVRNTPVITAVDRPQDTLRQRGSVLILLLLALIAGTGVGVLAAFALDFVERTRKESPEDLAAVRDALASGLRGSSAHAPSRTEA